jgi:hypothetical protein
MALLYGKAGRLTAKNGGFWPGQWSIKPWQPPKRSSVTGLSTSVVQGVHLNPSLPASMQSPYKIWLPTVSNRGAEGASTPQVDDPGNYTGAISKAASAVEAAASNRQKQKSKKGQKKK